MPKRSFINKKHIINSSYFLPNVTDKCLINDIKKDCWFDIQSNHFDIVQPNSKLVNISNAVYFKAKQIKLKPNKFQKHLLLKWFEAARQVYNLTVRYFKTNPLKSFISTRPIIKKMFNQQLQQFLLKYNVPVHIIDNSINDVCTSIKINKKRVKNGEITHFRMRYKKFIKDRQTIVLEKEDFSKQYNCFYRTKFELNNLKRLYHIDNSKIIDYNYLNILSKNKKEYTTFDTSKSIIQKDITCNVRLTYNKDNDNFILNIPKEYNRNEITKEVKICSIDPGYKTFLNVYDPSGCTYKIYNRDNININIRKLSTQKKDIEEYIKNKKYSKGKEIKLKTYGTDVKYYDKPLRKIKRYYNKLKNKLENKIKDLHYKSANFLCKNYTDIYLGKLSTKLISSKDKNLQRSEKLFGYTISHNKFRTILQQKSEQYGTNVHLVCEGYTSRTCGKCGNVKVIGLERIYNCSNKSCNAELDRDINAARNILIKHCPN